MKNWAGNVEFTPSKILAPTSTEEVQAMVKEAINLNKTIRAVGSGHSFTELISTQEHFLHLDSMQRILSVDKEKSLVRAQAGTKLYTFGEVCFEHGLAMENQGDINRQSLAGAMSTGTHGTGLGLQSVSNQAQEIKLVTGKGDLLTINAEKTPELFDASRVSFGSLGLMTEATLKLKKAYKLKITSFAESMDQVTESLPERLKTFRHVEMFYFPLGDWAMVKTMEETHDGPTPRGVIGRLSEEVLENSLYELLNKIALKTGSYQAMDFIMHKFVTKKSRTDWSHRAFPTDRSVRFMEMEYNIPVEKFSLVLDEIKASIKKHQFKTLFPIEIRFVKGDPIWLSPAYGRDSVYFAVHTYIKEDHLPYFKTIESIFNEHGGRPHWGKWHSLKNQDFEKIYPRWNEFKSIREKLDPDGRFLNAHLKDIFGLS